MSTSLIRTLLPAQAAPPGSSPKTKETREIKGKVRILPLFSQTPSLVLFPPTPLIPSPRPNKQTINHLLKQGGCARSKQLSVFPWSFLHTSPHIRPPLGTPPSRAYLPYRAGQVALSLSPFLPLFHSPTYRVPTSYLQPTHRISLPYNYLSSSISCNQLNQRNSTSSDLFSFFLVPPIWNTQYPTRRSLAIQIYS